MSDDSNDLPPPPSDDGFPETPPPGFLERTQHLVQDLSERTKTLFGRGDPDDDDEGGEKQHRTRNLTDLKQSFQRGVQGFDPWMTLEWANKAVQGQSTSFWGKVVTIVVCTFFFADLSALFLTRFIPEPPPVRPVRYAGGGGFKRGPNLEDYGVVAARNLFNSRGLIPGEETPGGPSDLGGPPVRTTLPFNLIGTVILRNELRSIATIEDKSASIVYPVRIEDEIPSKAKILKIEPRRVIFINTASGRREFVDLPDDTGSGARVTLGGPKLSIGVPSLGAGIEQVSPTQFSIARGEVDKALSDLNNILTQARAVPNFENGLPAGYKLFQIVPGSIYDKLGLKNGDVIAGIDGQTINDPGKAFEALSRLKETSHLDLAIKRDGKSMTHSYDIR